MNQSRRKFISEAAFATVGTSLAPIFLHNLTGCKEPNLLPNSTDRRLVIIQLAGGMDGLSVVVPYQNDIYYNARPKTSFKANKIIVYNDDIGFHPTLTAFESLVHEGHLGILNSVGYPNPDRSHFRSTDIWHTASNADEYLTTGWLGRYLDATCKPDMLNIDVVEIDRTVNRIIQGSRMQGFSMHDIQELMTSTPKSLKDNLISNKTIPNTDNENLHFLYKKAVESKNSADYLMALAKLSKQRRKYPKSQIGHDLNTTADLIVGGLETKVYYLSHGNFDTHAGQKSSIHWPLHEFNEALKAFVDDLQYHGQFENTLIVCFSEFGRRLAENKSAGTDHGAANQLFLIGGSLKQKGIINELPDLSDLENGDLKYKIDFREVYATLLTNWLKVDPTNILPGNFKSLGFV